MSKLGDFLMFIGVAALLALTYLVLGLYMLTMFVAQRLLYLAVALTTVGAWLQLKREVRS